MKSSLLKKLLPNTNEDVYLQIQNKLWTLKGVLYTSNNPSRPILVPDKKVRHVSEQILDEKTSESL